MKQSSKITDLDSRKYLSEQIKVSHRQTPYINTQ